MLLDMLDKAAVPELTGAMESIATHRQRFEGQGCMPCRAGGGTHAHTHTHTHTLTHTHTHTSTVHRRVNLW